MQYIFFEQEDGNIIRLSDNVRGVFRRLPDNINFEPKSALVNKDDFAEIQPEPEPVVVPDESPAWRIKAIAKLTAHGTGTLYDAIGAAISALDEPVKTIASTVWTEGNTIERQSTTVSLIASTCKLTSDDIDSIFVRAAALVV